MKFYLPYLVWIIAVVLTGCASSSPEEQNIALIPSQPKKELPYNEPNHRPPLVEKQPELQTESSPFEGAKPWTPRFIQTGLASGIMIEFTGMKKGRKLKARYANMELRRYLPDTTTGKSKNKTPEVSKPMMVQTAINDLQQAFFKVSQGKYMVRLTNEWADRSYVRDVEVKEGEYSVLTNDVYAPWLKMRQLSDSTEER